MMHLPFLLATTALFGILIANSSIAQTAGKCIESDPLSGNMQGQVLETGVGCSVMLSPNVAPGQALRRYSFSQRGVIQIFNQYSDNSNGSRSYFVFPRSHIPTLAVNAMEGGNPEMDVVTSAGDSVRFDTEANPPHILDDPSASFRLIENPVISKTNNGGVEIVQTTASNTLILDSGFQMGGAAFTHPTRTSTFRDAFGNHCTLVNSELFTFANYDAELKYTDAELFAFLKTACPGLKTPETNSN